MRDSKDLYYGETNGPLGSRLQSLLLPQSKSAKRLKQSFGPALLNARCWPSPAVALPHLLVSFLGNENQFPGSKLCYAALRLAEPDPLPVRTDPGNGGYSAVD